MNLSRLKGRALAVATMATCIGVGMSGVAVADNIQDNIVDSGTGVTLVAGSSTSGSANIRLVGNNAQGDPDPGCNLDPGEAPLVLDIITPAGITATPDPLSITSCGTDFEVRFTASSTARSGSVTVAVVSGPAGGGTYVNQVDIPITVTAPLPTNTKPSVAVTGVAEGAEYEIGSVPTATCAVSDAEDGPSSFPATITGTLSHDLGSQTATCDWEDSGGLAADTLSVTYRVVDTGSPTIRHELSSQPNGNGWYTDDVTVSFVCADEGGSGIASCLAEGGTGASRTFGEGKDQSVKGTATDWAGNTQDDLVTGIDVDKTAPTNVSFTGGPVDGARYYPNNLPAAPTCTADDATSGLAGCVVSGWSTALGEHTLTATATDNAGNQTQVTGPTYTVRKLGLKGFYAPVDMGNVFNTVKAGSTVPLKFEVFDGATELKDVARIKGFTTKTVSCTSGTSEDAIEELATTGGTALRFDSTADQFIQNWKTPSQAGKCFEVRMTTEDDSSISALFKLK